MTNTGVTTSAIAVACLFLWGCIPSGATLTQRPQVDTSPWLEKQIRSDSSGAHYNYLEMAGPDADAPVLLLLHGGIFDHRIWLGTQTLSRRFHVIALEYPHNSLFYTGTVSDWGRVVMDFVDALQTPPAYIAGVSNGAFGAIEYLLQCDNHQVKGLILISTVMLSINDQEIRKRTRMARFALGLPPAKLQGLIEKRTTKTDFPPGPGDIGQMDIFYVRPYPYYYQLFSAAANAQDHKQETHRIDLPVLVLHGEADDLMPVDVARQTTRVFDNATFISWPDQGHDMVFSNPDAVSNAILDHFFN